MGKWSDLTAQQKAAVIKFAIGNGVSDINTIRDTYNIYAEGGSIHIAPSKKGTFTAAAKKHGKSVQEFASQVLAHKENYSPKMVKKANFARNAAHWHDEGGVNDIVAPALDAILKNRNSLERKYNFITDTWGSEYTVPKGFDSETGLYYPYNSPEGGTQTIGPGLKLRADGLGDAYTLSAEEANNGVTKERINEVLTNHSDKQYQKVLEFLNQKGNRLPYDTVSPSIMRGLMDLRYQTGSLGNFNKLREAVLNGDLEEIKKESKVYYTTPSGRKKEDVRRNQHREENFWHYSTGGPLYPFSFSQIPVVRYGNGGKKRGQKMALAQARTAEYNFTKHSGEEGKKEKPMQFQANNILQNRPYYLYEYKPNPVTGETEMRILGPRPNVPALQNMREEVDPWGPPRQYVWDSPDHETYTAYELYNGTVPAMQILRPRLGFIEVQDAQASDVPMLFNIQTLLSRMKKIDFAK